MGDMEGNMNKATGEMVNHLQQLRRIEKRVEQGRQERQGEGSSMERPKMNMAEMLKESAEEAMAEEFLRQSKQPFSGKGVVLGAPTPAVGTSAAATPSVDHIVVSDSEPAANVQVRLDGGGREVVKVNLSHKVSHLVQEVRARRSEGRPFKLVDMGPPPRVLDNSITIKEAGLAGGSVMQRFT